MPTPHTSVASPKIDEAETLNRAVGFHKQGKLKEAKDLYRLILTHNPRHVDAMYRLGTIALQVEQFEKADEIIGQAIAIGPATATMYINHGAALRNLEKHDEAVVAYDKAIALDPNRADAYFNRGRAMQSKHDQEEAIANYRKAIELNPKDAQAWINLGTSYTYSWQIMESFYAFETASRLDPTMSQSYTNMASNLVTLHLSELAIPLFDKALSVEPDNIYARYSKMNTLLQMGDLERGWPEFSARFDRFPESYVRPPLPKPWDGVFREGECILFYMEQALGEQILALRTIPDLLKTGIRCVFECSARLVSICQRSFPEVEFISVEESGSYIEKSLDHLDYQHTALDLLQIFAKSIDDIPDYTPYLKPDPARVAHFREKYEKLAKGRRIVGFSWRSTNELLTLTKSAKLTDWYPILGNSDVLFVSVQYGDCEDDFQEYRKKHPVEFFVDSDIKPMENLEDAIAQIAAMDLIISISNTNVHMAGAMGVPTWLMLPSNAGKLWFWFTEGENSPWYSSVRVFRKKVKSDFENIWWPTVIDDVAEALRAWKIEPLPPRPDL